MAVRVFISSTSRDLQAYRQAAIEVCNRLQLIPVAMEFFEAMGAGATEGSLRKLDGCDVYVGIFAHRYGYIEPGRDRSITELEFDYAGDHHLDRLCFLVDPEYAWNPSNIDYQNLDKLNAFKERINQSLIRAYFTDIADFKLHLYQSLAEWLSYQHGTGAIPLPPADEMLDSTPPSPVLMVGREQDLLNLKQRLGIGGDQRRLTIVHGWPGVGKTTLVNSLAYQYEVTQAFPDGIRWISIGQDPDPLAQLIKLGKWLKGNMGKTLEEVMPVVRELLKDRAMLLIIDDVWAADAAAPFLQVAGPECSLLVTTRLKSVAQEMAIGPDEVYLLDILDTTAGIELLARIAPEVTQYYFNEVKDLVEVLEGLPLALLVAGRLLEKVCSAGLDPSETFYILEEEHNKLLDTTAPEDRFDPKTGTTPTISLLLKQSTDQLDPKTRERFAYLGAFAPKPATFDLESLEWTWFADREAVNQTIIKLVDMGLLEPIPERKRFWLHAVLVMHAKSLLAD